MGSLLNSVRTRLFGEPELQQTDVTDELRGAGTAFAVLIEGVGKAVAATQQELDATAGHIATEMAKLKVDTVQAVVSNYDNDGLLTGVKVITGKTSALSIAVPPALSFKRVHIEGNFVATEFAATSTSNVNINLAGASVGGRGFGASVVNANTDIQSSQTVDSSVASMSMTTLITPKPVTAVAKPPLIFKGPKLAITVFAVPTVEVVHPTPVQPTDPPYLEKRNAVIQIQLTAPVGGIISTKAIAIDCGMLDWGVTDSAGADVATGPKADSTTGSFFIKVSRTATASADPKKDFVIRASLNLVHDQFTVSL